LVGGDSDLCIAVETVERSVLVVGRFFVVGFFVGFVVIVLFSLGIP
jgi:hypothetical protein